MANNHSQDGRMIMIPATKQQQQCWIAQQLSPERPINNLYSAFQIEGILDAKMLKESITKVITRHSILRTQFEIQDGQLIQMVNESSKCSLMEEEIAADSNESFDDIVKNKIERMIAEVFNPTQNVPFRVFLFKGSNQRYFMLILTHELIADYYSLTRFVDEVSSEYQALSKHEDNSRNLSQFQYEYFSKLQQKKIAEESNRQVLEYWKASIDSNTGLLDIPISKLRPTSQRFIGSKHSLNLSSEINKQLDEICKELTIEKEIVFLTVFQILLFRYTNSNNISIGIPFKNRNAKDLEGMLGPTENVLPIIRSITGKSTFLELLKGNQENIKAASKNQDVTFDSIVEIINPVRDKSYNPLYQVGFEFRNAHNLILPGITVQEVESHNGSTKLDLFLRVKQNKEKIFLGFEYNADLYDSASLDLLSHQYLTLLESSISNLEVEISSLDLIPEKEKHLQLIKFNDTNCSLPPQRIVHRFFEDQVDQNPDKIAVESGDNTYSYFELDQKANQLANFLRSNGVKTNDLVGVCLERSCEMMVALLGVLKSGGGYIPMDPEYPKERLAYIAENSKARVLITQQSLKSLLPDRGCKIILIDDDWDLIKLQSLERLTDENDPNNVAYVIYTSGSTGKPKGVQVHHGAISNLMQSMAKMPGMSKNDVLISITTYSFDLSVPDLYLPLFVGAKTVYIPREIAADGVELARVLREKDATFMQATPSTWTLLLEAGWEGKLNLTALCGGEAWPGDLAQKLVPCVKELWNMYGPTETTVWSTYRHIEKPGSPVLAGKPIDNTSVYILDDKLQMMPLGVPGELHIGGHGVSLGYLGRPELNKESFLPNPFEYADHKTIYKTGDLVRFRIDGNIEYINRLDNQVKIRGLRIELGEIESVILAFPGIKRCVVVVREDRPGDKRLVGYFIKENDDSDVSNLREFLKEKLTSYMVPHHLVSLPEFPKTPNGKLDQKALPAPSKENAEYKKPYSDPDHLKVLPFDQWFYRPVWKQKKLPNNIELPQASVCLVFLDDTGVGLFLTKNLRKNGYEVITVKSSDAYYKFSDTEYCLNPEQGVDGYLSLIRDIRDSGIIPNRIAHLWSITCQEEFRPGSNFFNRNLEHGYYSLDYLSQALSKSNFEGQLRLIAVANGSQIVNGENAPYFEKSCSIGPCWAIPSEILNAKASFIDLDIPYKQNFIMSKVRILRNKLLRDLSNHVIRELLSVSRNEIVAYRNGIRWIRQNERVNFQPMNKEVIKSQGVYLVTGGFDYLGFNIVKWLMETKRPNLIIVDQEKFPDRKNWSDLLKDQKTSTKNKEIIKAVQTCEKLGGNVTIHAADVANAEEMKNIMNHTLSQFNRIDGVFHIAGSSYSNAISILKPNEIGKQFADKVSGTKVLDELFHDQELDLFVLFSSRSSVSCSSFQTHSRAVNSFVNAYAESKLNYVNRKTITIAWDFWKDDFLDSGGKDGPQLNDTEKFNNYLRENGISPKDGVDAFDRILSNASGLYVVSPFDLEQLSKEIDQRNIGAGQSKHVSPSNELEKTLARFWEEIIGIENVSVKQNFFDVGGHSLTAVRLFSRIKEEYNIQWPLSVLFDAPTISECAKLIDRQLKNIGDDIQINISRKNKFLVKLHKGPNSSQIPLFIVAGGFGNILNLRSLSQLIGKERTVYGLQAKGLLEDDLPHETFEEAASDYLQEVKKIQPEGPYLLGGFCSGGTIAYEMAQQLLDEGEKTSHLFMLDTIATDWREVLTKNDKLRFHLHNLQLLGPKYIVKRLKERIQWEWVLMRKRLGVNNEQSGPAVFKGREIFKATLKAENRYQPKSYPGAIILLRPKLDKFLKLDNNRTINRKREFVVHDNGWLPHVPHLKVEEIAAEPGDHDGFVLEPAVRDLANKLNMVIELSNK